MKEFVEHVARCLADHPDDVNVEASTRSGQIVLELHVHEEDMGRVIGKDGKVATALRTLLRMMAAREGQRVQLEIM